jgi:hypothetical protein
MSAFHVCVGLLDVTRGDVGCDRSECKLDMCLPQADTCASSSVVIIAHHNASHIIITSPHHTCIALLITHFHNHYIIITIYTSRMSFSTSQQHPLPRLLIIVPHVSYSSSISMAASTAANFV